MRTNAEAKLDKHRAVEKAEVNGEIADSFDIRKNLIEQVKRGEKTLPQVQAELAAIKRQAKKNGKLTREQVWSRS